MHHLRPKLLLKFPLLVFILVISAEGYAQSEDAGDSVSIDKIVSTWQSTRIMEVTVDFDLEYTSWEKAVATGGDSPSGGMGPGIDDISIEIDENDPDRERSRFVFRRHAEHGMRMTDIDHGKDQNVFGDRGVSIRPLKSGDPGMNYVFIQKYGSTSIQSLGRTAALLTWIDPLATRICTQVSQLSEASLPIIEDSEYGPIVQLTLREEGGSSRMVLAKKFDWRIVTLTTARSMELKHFFDYDRDPSGRLVLKRLTSQTYHRGVSDHPANSETLSFSNHRFHCAPEDLKIELPNNSFVIDSTEREENKYLIRHDGSIRRVTSDELRLAHPKDLIDTEEGDVFGQTPPDRTSTWIIVAGALLIGAALALVIKRLR